MAAGPVRPCLEPFKHGPPQAHLSPQFPKSRLDYTQSCTSGISHRKKRPRRAHALPALRFCAAPPLVKLCTGPRTPGARRHPSEPDRPYVLLLRNVAVPVQHKAATCPTRTVSPAIAAHRAQRRTPSLEVISMRRLTPMSHAPLSAQSEVVICTCISRALAASPIARNPHSCCSRSKTTGDTPP